MSIKRTKHTKRLQPAAPDSLSQWRADYSAYIRDRLAAAEAFSARLTVLEARFAVLKAQLT